MNRSLRTNLLRTLVALSAALLLLPFAPVAAAQDLQKETTCAKSSVYQGIAESVNGVCVPIMEKACQYWEYYFEYPTVGLWIVDILAYFSFKAWVGPPNLGGSAEDAPQKEANAALVRDPRDIRLDALTGLGDVVEDPGFGRAIAQGKGSNCLEDFLGVYSSEARAFGGYKEQWCQPDATGNVWCMTTREVPPNESKAPGFIIGTD